MARNWWCGRFHVEVTKLRNTCGISCESRDGHITVSFRTSANQKPRCHHLRQRQQPTQIWPDQKILPNEIFRPIFNKLQCS